MKKKLIYKPTLVLSVFAMLIITGCNNEEIIEPLSPLDENLDKSSGELKSLNPWGNESLTYDGFVNAFVVKDGNNQTYIVDGLQKRDRAYFWGQAFMITALIDGYERVQNDDRRQRVIDLVNSFLNQETYDWSWNTWTDDIAWAAIAVSRAYHAIGDPTYLSVAKNNWDFAYHRGWDNQLGGGLWENMDKHTKAALANNPMIISGILIYEANNDIWYLDRCKEIYAWVRGNLFDPNTGVVYEAVVNDGSIQYSDNAYNTGSFINAAASLYKHTGDKMYLNDAITAADHVVAKHPIIDQEGDACARSIAKLARENGLEWKYYPWLVDQCNAAWEHRRTDYNITQHNFTQYTATGEQYAMQCVSAVTFQSVTPEQAEGLTSGTYSIISKSSGKAMDVKDVSTEDGANIQQWTNYSAANQRWVVTSLGNNQYSITSAHSGKSLDIDGGGVDNGANVIQWGWHGGENQRWYIQPDDQGYYTIISVASGRALDVDANSMDNGANILQFDVHGSDNQKWSFIQ